MKNKNPLRMVLFPARPCGYLDSTVGIRQSRIRPAQEREQSRPSPHDRGFDKFISSATTPFTRGDLAELRGNAARVVERYVPEYREVFDSRGWRMLDDIERVYVNDHARQSLGWNPRYDFRHAIGNLAAGRDWRSELARTVGTKGYHECGWPDGI